MVYPFDRYLVCPRCGYANLLRNVKWTYEGHSFFAKCKNCGTNSQMEAKDKPNRNRSRMRLIRWFPQYIDIRYNNLTGSSEYILRIPRWLKTRIDNPKINKVYVADTPLEFLEAIRDNKNIVFDTGNIYHMKNETISLEDSSHGLPSILNVFKESWLWQVYKRGEEAVALEHILPMTMLSPSPMPGAAAPYMDMDLQTWNNRVMSMVDKWRKDQNAIFAMPIPMQVSQVRGDAQNLSMHNISEQTRQQIAGGMDVPPSFLYGGLTWTGASVDLRVLENLLINKLGRCNDFLEDWLLPGLRRFLRLPKINVKHADFKMADDVQQKQIAMNLRATNTVSDRTVLEQLDFDYAEEERRKKIESEERIREMEHNQLAQARIQAKITWIQARTQIDIQRYQQSVLPAEQPVEQPEGAQEAPPAMPAPPPVLLNSEFPVRTSSNAALSPSTVDLMANNFLKTTSPDEVQNKLLFMKQHEPVLASAVERRLKIISEGTRALEPLPEQKPPRRSPETAVI
jgi:hypothetical protein